MKKTTPKAVTFSAVPPAVMAPSEFYDEEAEAVKRYAEEERKAEEAAAARKGEDAEVVERDGAAAQEEKAQSTGSGARDPGSVVPQTPMVAAPFTPVGALFRSEPVVRQREAPGASDEVAKRAKVEDQKKQRIHRFQMEYEDEVC